MSDIQFGERFKISVESLLFQKIILKGKSRKTIIGWNAYYQRYDNLCRTSLTILESSNFGHSNGNNMVGTLRKVG